MWIAVVLLGLAVGVLVGLMGIGGGVVLVPALVHLVGLSQHVAQGTTLFLQLPPLGLGAVILYWKKGSVNLSAGLACAAGFLLGGFFGSLVAIRIPSSDLRGMFGVFLMVFAMLLWPQHRRPQGHGESKWLTSKPTWRECLP
ncbi:MAG TPA: sulfite exporter TauE/SafE family protein [Candidatus Acidoferrales bacterium]|jgi:uncharacterized membrane protein YfcA|nr:sulfite exporter TauE/SafE family protein [Candidatus Acidoferrales bacterium]